MAKRLILGTHNTMTYRKPKAWYMNIIKFMAKCQTVDYKVQHEKYGVNAFDIRVFWDKSGGLEFRHGIVTYDASDFYEILEYCNKESMVVRILFEERNKYLQRRSQQLGLDKKFIQLCQDIERNYPQIKFYGGRNARTNVYLYEFNHSFEEWNFFSSETALIQIWNDSILRMVDDWCPFIYAWLKNKKNKQKCQNAPTEKLVVALFDFINI